MKVRITKGDGWYSDKVGEVFDVHETITEHFIDADFTEDGRRFVLGKHCEIVVEENAESSPQSDAVDSPQHYTQGGVEVIDIIAQTVSGYDDPFVAHCVGTATKYLNRAPYKHAEPTEDLRKAKRYIEFAIDHLTKEDD